MIAGMAFLIFLFLAFVSVRGSGANDCSAVDCGDGSPDIQFPFKVQNLQANQCGLPGFELFCKENRTFMHFPSYGEVVVKSISYRRKKLNLLDPRNCVHEVFLNLNLSLTPFKYYYVLKEYSYFNCSAQISTLTEQVPCLSGPGHHVYVVEPSYEMPTVCKLVKTIAIPFSYSHYMSDNSFGLGLTWNLPVTKDVKARHESETGSTGLLKGWINDAGYKVLGVILFAIMVLILLYIGTSSYKKLAEAGQKQNECRDDEMEIIYFSIPQVSDL